MINKITKLGYSKREVEELLKVSKDINKDYQKLLKGYPIQYLIGYVDFYGNKILVNNDVLIPRYETEYLIEKTIKYSKQFFGENKIKILDIGTGSGCIPITLKKQLNCNVEACDISDKALNLAKQNAKSNLVDIKFTKSNLFENIDNKFDIIISNPPYISKNEKIMDSVFNYEPHIALFAEDNGLYFYKEILKDAKKYLNDKFIIIFEIGYMQGEAIKKIINENFNNVKVKLETDLSDKNRYIFVFSE